MALRPAQPHVVRIEVLPGISPRCVMLNFMKHAREARLAMRPDGALQYWPSTACSAMTGP
ncbi:MAG TPA: hypothetical protein VHJ18_24515 [Streptosporangiaceae bacterium]|jgi:hypothetical protein|nr:hypothetical protein [Streptosporangiaceae bacterium]